MKIWQAPYEFKRAGQPGLRTGALLKIEFEPGLIGYSDLHSWPELGDPDLGSLLSSLGNSQTTVQPLLKAALHWAQVDAEARSKGKFLLGELAIPDSHYLAFGVSELNPEKLRDISECGFRALKVKIGQAKIQELAVLNQMATAWPVGLRLRLDVNGKLSLTETLGFLEDLAAPIRETIEFIEDPTPNSNEWLELETKTGIVCAYDRIGFTPGLHKRIAVIKPALGPNWRDFTWATDLVVTGYLGHPLGQAVAAFVAGEIASGSRNKNTGESPRLRLRTCGLMSHGYYEPNAYSELLGDIRPEFPVGRMKSRGRQTGFGFDELLAKENWAPLVSATK